MTGWPTSGALVDVIVRMYVPRTGWVDITSDVRREGGRGVTVVEAQTGFNLPGGQPTRFDFEINNGDTASSGAGTYSPRNPLSPHAFKIGKNTLFQIIVEGEYIATGECTSGFPPRWETGGGDVWCEMVVEGRSRRLNADTSALPDPLTTAVLSEDPLWFWPMTDPENAPVARGAITAGNDVVVDLVPRAGPLDFAATSGPVGSSSTPDFSGKGSLAVDLPHVPPDNSGYTIEIWFKMATGDIPAGAAFVPFQIDIRDSTFPAADLVITPSQTTPGEIEIDWSPYAITTAAQSPPSLATRSAVLNCAATVSADAGTWHQVRCVMADIGGGLTQFTLYYDGFQVASVFNSANTYSWLGGSISRIVVNPTVGWVNTDAYYGADGEMLASLCGLAIYGAGTVATDTHDAGTGYIGEPAGERIERVMAQLGIAFRSIGDLSTTTPMGPQRAGMSASRVLVEASTADGGYLYDDRARLGEVYRTRSSLYNQLATLPAVYTGDDGIVSIMVDEEQSGLIENSITGTSLVAGTVFAEKTSGDRNINEPADDPQGVGRLPASPSYNVATPADLADAVGWQLRVGTLDAPRYPQIEFNLRSWAESLGLRTVYDRYDGRTVASGHGTADSGQAWTTSGGSATDFAVSGGVATMSLGSVGVLRNAIIDTGSTDFDVTVDISLPINNAATSSVTQWIVGRSTANMVDYYTFRVDLSTTGIVTGRIFVRSGGTLSGALGTATLGTGHTAGDIWRCRFVGRGSAFRAKAWLLDNGVDTSQPSGWHVTVDDTTVTAGTWAGVLGRLETGNTNTLPVVLTIHEFHARPLWAVALAAEPGDRLEITDTPVWIPGDIEQHIGGRSLHVANLELDVALLVDQATSWSDVGGPLETDTSSDSSNRWDSADSYLHGAIDASSTAVQVRNVSQEGAASLWTHGTDFLARIGGEDVTVSAVSTMTPAYVATGTASHSDNSTATPGLPAGGAAKQLLVLVAAARAITTIINTAALEAAGWSVLALWPHFIVATKLHSGSESAPTVSFADGGAGDTHSAVIFSMTGVQERIVDYATSDNSSAQNIAISSITTRRENVVALRVGWKQDDWTSVATLSGCTEVIDVSTTTGNDQGLVAAFSNVTGRALIAADAFTVTGGASAISRSAIILFDGNVQSWTVARGADGSTATTHADGEQVRLTYPMIWGW